MLSLFKFISQKLKIYFPNIHSYALALGKKYLSKSIGIYPRPLANECAAVRRILYSSNWNMAYGNEGEHEKLESAFAEFTGTRNAVVVNTGGMALQMSMRALGLKPGNEILLQVDTCSATASAVMNAGCTPIFCDVSEESFMLSQESVLSTIGPNTRAVIATHMWGNPESRELISEIQKKNNLLVIEDACLSLGTLSNNQRVGAMGDVGVFSFGCLKPIQCGEGGMIVTNNDALAKELRSLRHWGDRSIDYGSRDVTQLAWNGRISEILVGIIGEQLKGYPQYLTQLRSRVFKFQNFLKRFEGIKLVLGNAKSTEECSFTQAVLKIDDKKLGLNKDTLRKELSARGINTWHANFEAINSFTFFKNDGWKNWVPPGSLDRTSKNYAERFPHARNVFENTGLGINKIHFNSDSRLRHLLKQLESVLSK